MANLAILVGKRIRQIRKDNKISQEKLGEMAQLQSSYIGGVERGERNISLETLEKIIKAFDMQYTEFLILEILGTQTNLLNKNFLKFLLENY
ncbi:helix-turn-helix domain-containing protein [Paenibacillus sp. HGF5]|uniref:helix-turn-helix domain-containing protein n=1 Tax=Paenibacillus sp. HGF5 TaxID=908341 RepID=UPI000A078625|nr:helix-turn-helix transcriptional regulator [Paenibacillus sp. HGF5]